MVGFQKFWHFSAFLFLDEYESAEPHMNFLCLKFWDTLKYSATSSYQYSALSIFNAVLRAQGYGLIKVLRALMAQWKVTF